MKTQTSRSLSDDSLAGGDKALDRLEKEGSEESKTSFDFDMGPRKPASIPTSTTLNPKKPAPDEAVKPGPIGAEPIDPPDPFGG